jgi:GT2 family glycosyltransferase
VSEVPPEVERLVAERARARAARDFARADALRARIAALGFEVRDAPGGTTVVPRPVERVDPARVPSILDRAATLDVSVHVLWEGFAGDLERFLAGLERHSLAHAFEVVIVDNASPDAAWLDSKASERVRVLHLDREVGYAEARNAGLKTSRGRVVVLADLSVEPTGDILGPLVRALDDPTVGAAGPWGLVSSDLREFVSSPGPEVDAIEGYLLATRRDLLARAMLHERFRWYRHADVDLCFQLRALGTRAVVVPVPAVRHVHRGWTALDEAERARRSKRNWYLLLDRWKRRHDLLLSHRRPSGDEGPRSGA